MRMGRGGRNARRTIGRVMGVSSVSATVFANDHNLSLRIRNVSTIVATIKEIMFGRNAAVRMSPVSTFTLALMATISGSPGLKRLPPTLHPRSNVPAAANGAYPDAIINGMRIGPTAAAEAVWGANRFNDKLAINLRVEPYNFASGTELVPTLKMKFSF